MQSHTAIGRRWRRFTHKFGSAIFFGIVMLVVLALVASVLWLLNKH